MAYNRTIYSKGTTTFKDLDISFMKNPNTGDLLVKTDVEAIKQSIKNLVFLNFGDYALRPLFGGNVRSQLFEPATQLTEDNIKRSITRVLQYEPRAEVLDVRINSSKFDSNMLDVTIVFNIVNAETVVELPIILKRTR